MPRLSRLVVGIVQVIPALLNIMHDSITKPYYPLPPDYTERKRILTKSMMKFTAEELQILVKSPGLPYIFFDAAIDALLVKMPCHEFNDFVYELYAQ